ncbi:hypothetical protein AMATHDRAFT_64587 [Amanita thiersii Skay4041]|uniref:Multidrug resistance-associated ABC transporter n=1 Tax=Amanita thiersii Skay4041 TaxID=703135 RepID=A0A2A9NDX1_9AGAR|nr:hypothetical protein AMATHDRAFT_64587 [Amanita thiersii Skay4041]
MFNPFRPEPAPPGFGGGKVVPEDNSSFFSYLAFEWISPLLYVGYTRPLERDDLWLLPDKFLTTNVTDKVEANFYSRCNPEKRPNGVREKLHIKGQGRTGTRDAGGEKMMQGAEYDKKTSGDLERLSTVSEDKNTTSTSQKKQARGPKYDESLFKALHTSFVWKIWYAGILKLCADTLRATSPLVTKLMLTWLTESYVYWRLTDAQRAAAVIPKPKGVGYGIGLAFALFIMQQGASLMINHFMQAGMTLGLSVRTALIGNIFRKSLRLSGRAKMKHTVGQITTMISTDASRLDRFSIFMHNLWVAPIQLAIGIGLLLGNLGYSALVGLGVLLFGFPIQFVLVRIMFNQRMKGVKITDKRVRLTSEVLQGIRLIKAFAWEEFYAFQIGKLRGQEIQTIKKTAFARSMIIGVVTLIPMLAAILSFITYALSGHDLNVAVIFTCLQLFNIIRAPLIFLPLVLSSLSDALVALRRISSFLLAEELPEPYKIEQEAKLAVQVDGDFTWETTGKVDAKFDTSSKDSDKQDKKSKDGEKSKVKQEKGTLLTSMEKREEVAEDKKEEKPFELQNLNLRVPKGSFVGIVGRVGSGKSSVLQALIGEMRKTRGDVKFGGSVAYVPQIPWIRNATLRQNVLFGQEDDEKRFREIISACSLDHDLEILPHAEETEIGEKGINLSGGQKARVSLARAAYSASDIVLLDDPLSAVDAYVGKSILENCLLNGPLVNRTRILVTHALHVLDKTDYIYVMDNGQIIEQGTYESLMNNSTTFAHLMEEYGNAEQESDQEDRNQKKRKTEGDSEKDAHSDKRENAALMQAEERNTGAVTWSTYGQYLKFGGGIFWGPTIFIFLTLTQAAQVGNNLFLGFWTSRSVPGFRQGDYMAVYAGLGVAQAIFQFIFSFAFALASLFASLNLFKAALRSVLRSPASFFDTTPLGRIMSRLSKDQDTLDNELALSFMQALSTFSSVIGTIALVFYIFPLLGIIFGPMIVLYYIVSLFYRRTSVETKRLDSLMRSALYASYNETLTGLSTIRAYREQSRATHDAECGLDLENRAYYMTISIQRWLSVRLDMFGNLLVLGIGLFAAGFRHTVDPSKIGVVLTYTLGILQFFSDMVAQFAQTEQNMNAVERVLHYTDLPPEGNIGIPVIEPPADWPPRGDIKFDKVEMSYREGLPLVLKGISFEVHSGEKIGIVGRTGAGKSSLMQALLRFVELQSGQVTIDGQDISSIDLFTLRSRLALVPQDTVLFLGTLRENLDPQGLRTDAELISVLQRAWLLPREGPVDPGTEAKFSLDSTVGDEGSNFSAGEKQLLALCRALVKNSRIIILDEATSNVDVETDAKLQRTIQTEFSSSTLLCIAHRLNTIAYYDRVLVMDNGVVAEFDTVLNLFDREDSILRSLCNEANLSRADIVRIREEHDKIQQQHSGSLLDVTTTTTVFPHS